MKNCLDNNWKPTWIACSLVLTVAAVGGFALVRGQDTDDPARPVADSPNAAPKLKLDSVPGSKQPSEPLNSVPAGAADDERDIPEAAYPQRVTGSARIILLGNVSAEQVIETLKNFIDKEAVKLSVANNGNAIRIAGSIEAQEAIQALVARIDSPQAPVFGRAELQPAGSPGWITYQVAPQPGYKVQPADPYAAEVALKYQQLLTEIASLVKQYRESEDEAKQGEIRDRIQALTDEQFDLRQKGRELEVERLKQRVVEVEGSVQKRKHLKGKIVARRVEDLLTGSNELQWESAPQPPTAYYGPAVPTRAANDASSSLVPPRGFSAPTNQDPTNQDPVNTLPGPGSAIDPDRKTEIRTESRINTRYVPRQVTEQVVGPNGQVREVKRIVYELERVNVPVTEAGSGFGPMLGGTPPTSPSPAAGSNSLNTPSYYPHLASGATVAEAETRLRIAERKLSASRALKFHSNLDQNEHRSKLADLEGDVDLAKLQLAQAKRSYEAARQFIDLEVRRANAVFEAAKAELEEAKAINSRAANSIPQTAIRLKENAVEQAQLAVQRALTWLELHRDSNAPIHSRQDDKETDLLDEVQPPKTKPANGQSDSQRE